MAFIAGRINLDFYFALPAGEDGPIVIGRGAASTGFDLLDLKRLVALILDHEFMHQGPAFNSIMKIKRLLR